MDADPWGIAPLVSESQRNHEEFTGLIGAKSPTTSGAGAINSDDINNLLKVKDELADQMDDEEKRTGRT